MKTMYRSRHSWLFQALRQTSDYGPEADFGGYDLRERRAERGSSFCNVAGLGACAINPYLAHESIRHLIDLNMLDKDYYAAVADYDSAVLHGIVKIASKMGVSTIQSYQGSQIFEAVGISKEVIDRYFTDTVSRVGGVTLKDIAADVDALPFGGLRSAGVTGGSDPGEV